MPAFFLAAIVLLLPGCFGGADTRPSPASHDLSPAQAEADSASVNLLRQIEVRAPSWLDTTAMQYRLSYADRTKRQAYAESRWVAPPARLLEQRLKRRLLSGDGSSQAHAADCRLRLELDELVQDFDRPGGSQMILEARATLLAPRGDATLARQHFRRVQAAGADARGGVVALEAATRQLAGEIENWLKQGGHATSGQCRLGPD